MSLELPPPLTIVLVASFVAASCALVGSFLVLRRMALLGDAISHSVLPGIAIAFLLTGETTSFLMVLGAGALGVLTVFLVEILSRSRRLYEDAAIGVVFPALFALGVILINRYAHGVHLDVDCVLYGEIAYAPLDTWTVAGVTLGPRALWVAGSILLLDVALVIVLYKELKLASFDSGLAVAMGLSPVVVHYVLMSAVSVTVVGAFESVGAILVVAMLVVPPATAYLLTRRLKTMIALAVAFGIAAAVVGYMSSRALDCSIAGAMASAAGLFFVLALFLSPHEGLVAVTLRRRRLRNALEGHLVLLHLGSGGESVESVARRFGWRGAHLDRVLRPLLAAGFVEPGPQGLCLTEAGDRALLERGTLPLAHRLEGENKESRGSNS
jgi:manganese/zinc/iron transport system permease protein